MTNHDILLHKFNKYSSVGFVNNKCGYFASGFVDTTLAPHSGDE